MAETKLSCLKDKRWSLDGMTALVTGATRGIGHAIAEELAEFGAAVHICSRNQQDIDQCLEEWNSKGFRITGSACDVLSRDQRENLIKTVASTFDGKLNILTRIRYAIAEELAEFGAAVHICSRHQQDIDQCLEEWNSKGFRITGSACDVLSRDQRENLIKTVASTFDGKLNILKSAVEVDKLVEAMEYQIPIGRLGEPKDISGLVAFLSLLAASYITGQIITLDGGYIIRTPNGTEPNRRPQSQPKDNYPCAVIPHDEKLMAETKLEFFKDKRWSLHGMTALVTGGTRGIGYAIAEELAEFGAAVHICARNQQDIDQCLEQWSNKGFLTTGSVCDVLSPDQREKLMKNVASIFNGKLNILINNAGTASTKSVLDYTREDVATLFGTNFESCFHLCQLAHPLLKASGYGRIVFISSISGLKAFPLCSIYGASKGALNQFTKNIALEWAKDNIRANTVAPGPVKTVLLDFLMKSPGVDKNVETLISGSPVSRI
ncbi:hypothetical protein VNO78_15794 [Psophocarpus tetragonolobus]|uniref:Tropinone reductase I n=1 Tax=Psophocarpus tetragonolobus TaxID=3891 RepID=A0AAN9SEP2_PSOTE